jgi:hypothetical protein
MVMPTITATPPQSPITRGKAPEARPASTRTGSAAAMERRFWPLSPPPAKGGTEARPTVSNPSSYLGRRAMAMAVGRRGGPVADINVTPMADVIIVLLIIFMSRCPC